MSESRRQYQQQVQQIQEEQAERDSINAEKTGMINKAAEAYDQQQADTMGSIDEALKQRRNFDRPQAGLRHDQIGY